MDKFLEPVLVSQDESLYGVIEIRLEKIAIDEVDVTISETR